MSYPGTARAVLKDISNYSIVHDSRRLNPIRASYGKYPGLLYDT